MTIVNMKNFPVTLKNGFTKLYKGFAIINEDGKFLSLDGETIYIPCGGRKALNQLLPEAHVFHFVALH